ncbi:hypothetical protein [Aequorivita antarctica]|uniref:Outer membrane lipoprotein-sorting protein n=1 Tax=Aequorivita antarctica TaxID=153266 RepID=A0A5C6YYV7_9FLAO|nr:hypothetical protein [Aequorivita antarctica]TXD72819.1 hypothetical protein ESU54_11425 [Aequorivita antarctica]SRX75246.1 hypothetical protein AEQU3_02240 [Aequorivita antarctica]
MIEKKYLKHVVVIVLIFLGGNIIGQTSEKLLKESFESTFGKQEFEVETNYRLYKGMEGTKVFENYSGINAKKGNSFYQKIGAMELLIGDNLFVKLNHEDKEITIGVSNEDYSNNMFIDNVSQLLKYYCEGLIINEKGYEVIEMYANPEKNSDIAKMKIYTKNGKIIKQVFYLSQVKDFSIYEEKKSEKLYDVARLEVEYRNIKYKTTNSFFEKERYFTIKDNNIILGKEFKDFEFFPAN